VRFVENGISGEERWLNVNLKAQALPNGYCGLPLQMQCPHANACHTCSHFQTDVTFLPIHRKQLEATRTIIEDAKSRGHNRQVEMNAHVATNLEHLVASLEHQAGQV
jgi:integrase/recombinase XerD